MVDSFKSSPRDAKTEIQLFSYLSRIDAYRGVLFFQGDAVRTKPMEYHCAMI